MNEFLNKTKQNLADRKAFEDKAYSVIIEDLVNNNIKDAPIGAGNQEKSPGIKTFYPGHIYIFNYKAENKISVEISDIETIEFFDKMPLVLCTNFNGKYIEGINLNMCPFAVKTSILNEVQNIDPEFFNGGADAQIEKGKYPVSTNLMQLFLNPKTLYQFKDILIKKYNLEKDFVIFRKYSIGKITSPKLIELWAWKYIPFLSYKSSIREATLKLLQSNIIKKQSNSI